MKPSHIFVTLAIAALSGGMGYYLNSGSGSDTSGPAPGGPRGFGGPTLVEITEVITGEVYDSIESIGTLTANESVTVTAKVTETISKLHFEDGELVDSGHILAELTSREESAMLAEAQANLDESERQLNRLIEIGSQLASESQIDEARARVSANQGKLDAIIARIEDRLIRAPFSGLLGFREVSPGTLVTPGTAVTTLDDIETLKLDFSIPETLLGSIRLDSRVIASSSAWPEHYFEGVVSAIDSRVNPVTRAVTVRALLNNEELLLRPGMLMTTEVVADTRQALIVPESALIQTAAETYVYVVDDEMTATKRPITYSKRWRGNLVLESGLVEGEQIVTSGAFKLRPFAKVQTQPQETGLAGTPSIPDAAKAE